MSKTTRLLPKKLSFLVDDPFLAKLVPFDSAFKQEILRENSTVREYVTNLMIRVVLEKSTQEERMEFKGLWLADEDGAMDWVLEKLKGRKEEVMVELVKFVKELMQQMINPFQKFRICHPEHEIHLKLKDLAKRYK